MMYYKKINSLTDTHTLTQEMLFSQNLLPLKYFSMCLCLPFFEKKNKSCWSNAKMSNQIQFLTVTLSKSSPQT